MNKTQLKQKKGYVKPGINIFTVGTSFQLMAASGTGHRSAGDEKMSAKRRWFDEEFEDEFEDDELQEDYLQIYI